ncbi:dormancy-associated protein-like protein 3-like isoform X1 [Gossypium australe]|uniref:Dormancy-associated protein-like protein 3-like isoform X1 n=1 Tax=Gossypium australe TaxID=47621 RepID=A0A5B6VTI1_9ROSI|nr:dormancy-associated protein-like protein 3-like isoform X1 [Gossypium australe]
MGLLDQLWDDTVAGPRPDTGLGKLRKQSKFSFWPNSAKESDGGSVRSNGDETSLEEATRVTRTIMIVKPPGYQTGSPPVSPAGTTPPVSPFAVRHSKVAKNRISFGEDRYRMRTRRPARLEQGALILLRTCEL